MKIVGHENGSVVKYIAELTTYFLVYIVYFILNSIIKLKIKKKVFFTLRKFLFLNADSKFSEL